MAVTFGDVRESTLSLLDELDTSGVIQTTADVTAKIRDFTNKAMVDLAATTAKIHGEQYIIHSPVYEGSDTSQIQTFLPDGEDISITLENAKSCFFEATGPGTVVIEEAVTGSETYTALETITIASTVTTLTEYRRLITPSLSTNTIRLRFTGSYTFSFRNHVLYPYTFATAALVQQFRPYFEYALNADFLQLDKVMVKYGRGRYSAYTSYTLDNDNKLRISRYDAPAEFIVHYWRLPTKFTFTEVEATDDALVFGIDTVNSTYRVSDEAANIIPLFVAAKILKSEGGSGLTFGGDLMNDYEFRKSQLLTNSAGYVGEIANVTGW